MKKIFLIALTAIVLSTLCVTAYAKEGPDMSRDGSITVTMCSGSTAVAGGEMTLYRAGDIREDDGNYSFALSGEFADSGVSLADLQSADTAKALAGYAETKKLGGTRKEIGRDGTVSFPVKPGLYLLVQTKAADGYEKAEPFLAGVPMNRDGVYVYDVDASPKVGHIKPAEPKPPVQPKEPSLPQTGQLNWPIPLMTVCGLLLFSAGWVLLLKKKGNHEA